MMRVRVPSAEFSTSTLREVANIAEEYGRGFLDVTDRQAFQFHWLTIDKIPRIFERLEPLGLHPRGACGDTVRAVIATSTPMASATSRT